MKRIIFLVLSFLSSSIMVYARNNYATSSTRSKLILCKAYPAHNIHNQNVHSSHAAHFSHRSHYSSRVSHNSAIGETQTKIATNAMEVKADSTSHLSKKQIDFIHKKLCKEYKTEANKINILRAYKSDRGDIYHESTSSIKYGVINVIYLKVEFDNGIYEYLIPLNKKQEFFMLITNHQDYSKTKYSWMNKIEHQ